MKKLIVLLFFVVNFAFGQSVTLQPGSNGFVAIPAVASLPSVTAADKGKMVFLTTTNKFYFCDGSNWVEPLMSNGAGLFSYINSSYANTLFNVENTNTNSPGSPTVAIKGTANSSIGIGIAGNSTNGVAGNFVSTASKALQTSGGLRFSVPGVGTPAPGKVLKSTNSSGDAEWDDVLNFPYAFTGSSIFPTPMFGISNTNFASGSTAVKGEGIVGVRGEVPSSFSTPALSGFAVVAENKNTGGNGSGIYASHAGSGYGGSFYSNTGIAGYFSSASGNAIITGTGNVGIGTSTPHAPLQFSNVAVNRKIVLYETANNDHEFYGLGINGFTMRYQVDATSANHIFYAATSGSTSDELMRITGGGNVGIGNNNPTASLHVYRGTGVDGTAAFAGTQWSSHFSYSTNEHTYIRGGKNGSHVFVNDLATLGNVAIGNGTPTEKLHVFGNLRVSGTICNTSGTIAACSDIRYKKNFSKIENPLNKVLAINGLHYDWRVDEFKENNFSKDRQIGFIVQEIEKIFPEMVFTDEKGYKSVDYARLTPVLVEAMKELKMMNDELKSKNGKLESRLDKIEAVLYK